MTGEAGILAPVGLRALLNPSAQVDGTGQCPSRVVIRMLLGYEAWLSKINEKQSRKVRVAVNHIQYALSHRDMFLESDIKTIGRLCVYFDKSFMVMGPCI